MRKTLFFLATIAVIFGMIFSNTIPTQAQNSIAWTGAWQMGPSMDAAALWGGSVGDGAARFSGTYYNGFVYFLGVRDSNDSTYGAVFKFDVNTQTFSATGVSMPTPVSNYLISVIENDGRGHGAGLYILGGRKNDATLNNLIQVYYPLDNSVTSITTDPVPGIARNIGGQVAVNGKIYIFGGFNSTTMYAESYDYDPAAAVGSRWTNLGCNLPTPRSYISAAAIGNLIYAMGGDEYNGTNLVPIAQTLVFDTTNPSACWVDAGMPDLPIADGDAPAVYVSHADNAYLGGASGAIFVIGGYWPSPGPYRWVFRYDVAGNTWEQFPQLAIPAPATGRRNQAAIYIPSQALNGLGAGVPGIWTFGGVDNYANAMTATSEFFSITNCTAVLLPEQLEADTVPGGSALHHFSLLNQSGSSHVFNLSFTSDQPTWVTTMPVTLSVDNNTTSTFNMSVAVPASVSCPATGNFTVTATAQGAPSVTDSQAVTVKAVCGLAGTITDANTGLALQGAYVWMQTDPNGLTGDYYDAYTDANGQYLMINVNPGTYLLGADHQYYQPSFLPAGWPDGAVSVTIIADTTGPVSVALKASTVQWSPTDKLTATVIAGETGGADLILDNTAGTAPLHFSTSIVDSSQAVPPPAMSEGVPGLPRLDPQIESDMANSPDGAADFVVVLTHKADLSQAYNIQDWYERGQYVYNTLTQFANRTQTGLRRYLDAQGASYTPLYIINGVIVRGGNSTLTNTLLARPDVLQLVGNHAIAMDAPTFNVLYQPYAVQQPESIGWNITNTNAPQVWSTYGDKGAGITVAEIDTGTQWDHPALKAHYRGWDNGTGTVDHNYNWFDPYNQSPLVPRDTSAHGTHVMGTMVGDDGNPGTHQIGMAPGAKWITCKGGDEVSGYLLTHELLVCAQWIVAPTDLAVANPDPAKRPDVVNNSWGGGPNDYWYTDAVSAWKAAGIFSQFANGNSGPFCSTAHSPGDYWNTFAAGATSSTNAIASFSSRGPAVGTNILKPDIAAPGVNIWSSVPSNAYAAYDGTSMASPHVAGAVALLWSAVPELKGQIDLTNWILEQTATPLLTTQGCGGDTPTSHPNNVFGWGLLNIKAAVDLAKQTPAHTPGWVSVYPSAGGTVPAGSSVTLRVKFTPPSATPVGLKTFTLWLVSDDPYNHDASLPIEVTIISELKLYLPGVMKTP